MKTLHMTNGMATLTVFKERNLNFDGELAPFNEAMCDGNATSDIFGADFIEERASVHGGLLEDYEEIVLNPLKPFFMLDYDLLTLYFDEDMFCQINLITILGYLDKNNYEGRIILNLLNAGFKIIKSVEIKCIGFYQVYLQVLINHIFPECILPEVMLDGVINYLQLVKDDNEVDTFIRNNLTLNENELLDELFEKFSHLGLGDLQYLKRIDKIKNNY